MGVWNKQEAKTYIYVDGELKGTMDAPGNYVPPTTTTSYWFGIGVDASATVGQNAWKGDVAIARVYDAPLTAEKVKALWETVKRDQQPAAINITGLLYLSGCEVGADYTYTLYGKGFAAGDRIRFEPLAGSAFHARRVGRSGVAFGAHPERICLGQVPDGADARPEPIPAGHHAAHLFE